VSATSDALNRLLALLHDVRTELQNLQESIDELKAAATADGATESSVRPVLERSATIYVSNRPQIERMLKEIDALCEANADLYKWAGAEVSQVENLFERVVIRWPGTAAEPSALMPVLDALDTLLDRAVYAAGMLTTADRLEDHLKTLRVGQSLDFNATFADELPKEEQREAMLENIGAHPIGIDGLVDVAKGWVYKMSPRRSVRALTYVAPLLAMLTGVLAVWLLASLDDWGAVDTHWSVMLTKFRPLFWAYVFIVVGGVVHVLVSFQKQRSGDASAPLVMGGALAWLHVRYASICLSVIWFVFGLLGLAIVLKRLDWATAFFVGYSFDSFAEVFLKRFESTAAGRVGALKKVLS